MPSSLPPKHHDFTTEQTSKPWKYEAPYSLALLEFCVENASVCPPPFPSFLVPYQTSY